MQPANDWLTIEDETHVHSEDDPATLRAILAYADAPNRAARRAAARRLPGTRARRRASRPFRRAFSGWQPTMMALHGGRS